jgi:hypothetical protein
MGVLGDVFHFHPFARRDFCEPPAGHAPDAALPSSEPCADESDALAFLSLSVHEPTEDGAADLEHFALSSAEEAPSWVDEDGSFGI